MNQDLANLRGLGQRPRLRRGSAAIRPKEGCPSWAFGLERPTGPGAGSGTNHWAPLGMEYLAAAGRGLPTAAATVRSANSLSSEGSPGLNLVLPSSMRVSPTAYFMSVAVWYPHLVRMDDDGRVIIGRCVEQAAEVIATRKPCSMA